MFTRSLLQPSRKSSSWAASRATFTPSRAPSPPLMDFASVRVSAAPEGRSQAKLVIGQPGDRFEREADAVADRVMREEDPALSLSRPASGIQRACDSCQEEDEKVRMQALGEGEKDEEESVMAKAASSGLGAAMSAESATGIQRSRGGGAPLDRALRGDLEPRFGHSFADVRIHADREAASLSRSIGARAFTIGSDVFFGEQQYQPDAPDGRRLLAHELTHVLQQRTLPQRVQRVPDEDGVEDERYSYATHCGWIDWGHTNPTFARGLIGLVREASQRVKRRETPVKADVEAPALASESSCVPGYDAGEQTASHTEAPVQEFVEHASGVIEIRLGGYGVNSADGARFEPLVSQIPTANAIVGRARGTTYSVQVSGFTDCVGSERQNAALRQQRAVDIAGWLAMGATRAAASGGPSLMKFTLRQFPLDRYLSTNATRAGRKKNRGALIQLVPTVAPEDIRTPRMESHAPVLGLMSGVTLEAELTRSLSEPEILSVAYALFLKQSAGFESLQEWTDWLAASSYSEEDLPSNNISFYRAARGYSSDEVETLCDDWGVERSLEKLDGYTFQTNTSFEAIRLPPGGAWPAEFRTIAPANDELVRVVGIILDTAIRSGRCVSTGGGWTCE